MRRNWSKRLTALMLAILVFAALGTVALADETDPEKDLVIGSEYGGGGSPGEGSGGGNNGSLSDDFGEPGRLVLEGDPLWDDVQAIMEAENSVDGVYTGSDAINGNIYVRYGQNPLYYEDGSWGVDVKVQNGTGKDITLDWSMIPIDGHGAALDVLDMGSYVNSQVIKHGYIRNFRVVFSEKPASVECKIDLADGDGNTYDPVAFTMRSDNTGYARSTIVNPYPKDHPIWSEMDTISGTPCEDCGVEPMDETVIDENPVILICVLVCIAVFIIGILLVLYLRHKKHKNKKGD